VDQVFTPAQLQEDFSLMREVFTTLHPALYAYVAQPTFERLLDSIQGRLNTEMGILAFFKLLSPIIAQIGCGHTAVGLPRSEEHFIQSFMSLKLKFLDGRAYIIEDYSNSLQLRKGYEVIAINGEPVSQIVNQLFACIPTDGFSTSNKYLFLDRKFDLYYGLHIAQPDTFTVEVVNHEGVKKIVQIPALQERGHPSVELASDSPHPYPFYLDVLDSITAVMTIDLFYVYDQNQQKAYPRFLDSCFSLLNQKKIDNLVIDVRQNPGGYGTWGALLYSYLADAPFEYYNQAVVASNKPLPFREYLTLDYTEKEYQQYLEKIVTTDSGTLVWTNHENLEKQLPKKNRFSGSVYVLVGRKSFSTTAEFCAVTYSNRRATFVGEETGGGYYHINGGDLAELTLPHTGIKFQIPMRKYELAVREVLSKGRGTIPDYYVPQSIEDYLSNQDTEMNFTLKLIEVKKK
ncbi:MAG: S41 family peptidase, partial [Bacteroidota bacterium]